MKSTEKLVRGIPDFLAKLWYMLNDNNLSEFVNWTSDGNAFVIRNDVNFCFKVLPQYYKHNNMSSFIRQLNLYGFNKVTSIDDSSICDRNEFLFSHPFFKKGQPHLLKMIKRKVSASKAVVTGKSNVVNETEQLSHVLEEVKYLKDHQIQVENVISTLQTENNVMWREFAMLRQKHIKLQQIVNKLIHFLVTIVQPSNRMGGIGVKRRYPLMIKDSSPSNPKNPKLKDEYPTIYEIDNDNKYDPCFQFQASTSQEKEDDLLKEISSIPNIEQPLSVEVESPLESTSKDWINVDSLKNADVNVDEYNKICENLTNDNEKTDVLLNPMSGDALLATAAVNTANVAPSVSDQIASFYLQNKENKQENSNMSVVTMNSNTNNSHKNLLDDISELSVNSTESDLEHLKDVLSSCSSIDYSILSGLFNEPPSYGLPFNEESEITQDELLSGSEIMPYDPNILDLSDFIGETTDPAPDMSDQTNFTR